MYACRTLKQEWWLIASGALVSLLLSVVAQPVRGDSITERLPQSTAAWIRLDDVSSWGKSFQTSQLSAFVQNDAFAGFREAMKKVEEDGRLVEQIGLEWSELVSAAAGDIVVAVIPLKGDRFSTLLAIEGAGDADVQELQATIAKRFADRGVRPKTGSMDELRVAIYRLSSDEQMRCVAKFGKWLLISDNTAALARFASSERGAPGLSEFAAFDRMRTMTAPMVERNGMRVNWYVDPWRFAREHLAYRMGFRAVRAVGGQVTLGVGSNLLSYRTAAVRGGSLEKAAKMLAFKKSTSPNLPKWYADEAVAIQSWYVDYNALIDGYALWFDQTHGEGDNGLFETVLEDIKLEPEGPRVDIRRDLIGNLVGPVVAAHVRIKKQAVPIYAIQVKNEDQVGTAIGRLFEGDPDVTRITVAGATAWRYGDLTRGGERNVLGPDLSRITLCVSNNYLFVTRHTAALEWAIKGADRGADSSETFNRIFDFANGKSVPAPFSYGASQGLGGFHSQYEQLRSQAAVKPTTDDATELTNVILQVWQQVEASPMLSAFAKTRYQLPDSREVEPLIHGTVNAGKLERGGWTVFGRVQLAE